MADAQVRSPRVFWYADHIERRVTEFQLAHRHRDPEQLIDVRVERHIFESRGLEEPPDPAMMPRAIDAALLRACATGLPRTIETLLKYGANPRVNFVGDERDSSVRIPAGCDPFCRSAVMALQRISGLGVRLAADFTRHFACARNVLRGGGIRAVFWIISQRGFQILETFLMKLGLHLRREI
uniref:Uncharacterized protein n=1 Tax=Chromera velia CCMP2878 TaxID=1169474 RepID=A0A0G4H9L0_9ALVE|eukprot:Cvel_5991.t1-p1 / transcript=Cvel_5991.t1 / gene=Cvel_5991 / organism=Chromera_velia_CCMP2878 / gene_product=hypothetical protein / transcript_product=hypothetical protein / location=Cvel_scaffold287:5378-5920(+) / protein_length=181 / sequence_SO=supercontig / SO=protein_coding / is_pseudo=false